MRPYPSTSTLHKDGQRVRDRVRELHAPWDCGWQTSRQRASAPNELLCFSVQALARRLSGDSHQRTASTVELGGKPTPHATESTSMDLHDDALPRLGAFHQVGASWDYCARVAALASHAEGQGARAGQSIDWMGIES
jgi:hypothetical protein